MRKHMSQSIRGALRLKDEDLGFFTHKDGSPVSPIEARKNLIELLDKGHDVMPVGECDNFDPKKGCLGHEEVMPE